MKAAVWTDYNKIEVKDVEMPIISGKEVLIKVIAAGLCITDLHVYTGQFAYGKPPHILGHEIAGQIVETGSEVNNWQVGDRVVVETSIGCGTCGFCKSGNRHLCNSLTEIGFTPHNGGYAQYVKVPAENLFRIPDNVTYEEAGIIESVVCPMGSLMRLSVKYGETVVVYGVGPGGISFIQGVKLLGAGKVIAVARNQEQLERAKFFGADIIINTKMEDVFKRVLDETYGQGADLVCEAAGAPETILSAIEITRRAGRVILYGIPGDRDVIHFPTAAIITKQLDIHGTVGNPFVWEPLLEMVSANRINLKDMVTHRFSLNEIHQAFEHLKSKKDNPIKIVIQPWSNEGTVHT